jgi:hypothetical protein
MLKLGKKTGSVHELGNVAGCQRVQNTLLASSIRREKKAGVNWYPPTTGQDMILGILYAYDGNTLQLWNYHCLSAGLRGSGFNFLNLAPLTFESFYIGVHIFTTFSTDLYSDYNLPASSEYYL